MDIISDPINEYATLYTSPEDEVLHHLNLETHANVPGAQMISGHLQGVFLTMISHMIQPKCILELGTYTGYSAICLAKGLVADGTLHTIDIDDRWNEMRLKAFANAGMESKIKLHIGDAHQIINELALQPDLVFIDADKKGYGDYFDTIIDKMPKGGIIIADNVLFKGEVILPLDQQKNATKHMHAFNIKISEDARVEQVILPLRDGISLIRKK